MRCVKSTEPIVVSPMATMGNTRTLICYMLKNLAYIEVISHKKLFVCLFHSTVLAKALCFRAVHTSVHSYVHLVRSWYHDIS